MPNQLAKSADKERVNPWQGTVLARAWVPAIVAAAVSCWAAPVASADESAWPTAQAKAYHFDFVPYLDPPAKPAAVCLVDSGVDVTPDTPADSPDGPIVKRLALDGGPERRRTHRGKASTEL